MAVGRKTKRNLIGTSMAEMPLALWIVIMAMAFPLIVMVMLSVKFGFFWNAARDACKQAASAQTFKNAPPDGTLSAMDTAESVANMAASSFSGISLVPGPDGRVAQVSIIKTDLTTQTPSVLSADQPLSGANAPPDPENFYYSIQVQLTGDIQPFIQHPGVQFGGPQVPGLTAPFRVTCSSQFPFENVQG